MGKCPLEDAAQFILVLHEMVEDVAEKAIEDD